MLHPKTNQNPCRLNSLWRVVWHVSFSPACWFGFGRELLLRQSTHLFSHSCPKIPAADVSLSHPSYSVMNDLTERSLFEGDLASQSLLLSACQLSRVVFQSPGWQLKRSSFLFYFQCFSCFFTYPLVQKEFQDGVWLEYLCLFLKSK